MAKFLSSAMSLFSKPCDPDTVREVATSRFFSHPVKKREDCLLMYGPIPPDSKEKRKGSLGSPNDRVSFNKESGAVGTEEESYEIVVQSDRNLKSCFSLFRGGLSESEARFIAFQPVIPVFLSCKPDLCSASSLQKLCDCVRQQPSYSLSHIAVHLDMVELLLGEDPRLRSTLDQVDADGTFPLMLAIKQGQKTTVAGVLAAGAPLIGCDRGGSNVFHHAAAAKLEILEMVTVAASEKLSSEELGREINMINGKDKTPLHVATEAENIDNVLALLQAGADLNTLGRTPQSEERNNSRSLEQGVVRETFQQFPGQVYLKDIKHGGTPLHWSMEKGVLEAFLSHGCHMEATNFLGSSALHQAVRHKRLPCIVSLLSHGAKVDTKEDNKEGNSALHLAVLSGHIPSIQALIVFGADLKAKNNAGDTPWTLALKTYQTTTFSFNVEKDRNMILHTLHSVGDEGPCDITPTAKDFDWKPPVTEKTAIHGRTRKIFDEFLDKGALNVQIKEGGVKILSLDGGGIKGLVLVKMLDCLTKLLNKPVTEMFDWITGTSTGGILSLALAVGKSTLECQGIYFKLKDRVFVGSRPYDVLPMEEFLKKELGEDLTMAQLPVKPRIAVTGTLADRYPADLHLFRNYPSPMELLGTREQLLPGMSPVKRPDQQTVWRAARSSGAAPTYFRAAGRFIDGGLVANNPTLDIMTELQERNQALRGVGRAGEAEEIGLILSLGTGEPPTEKVDSIDLFRPDSLLGVGQLMFGMSAMGRLLVDQASSATNRVVDRARAWCSMCGIAFLRLSPQLASDISLDETSDEVLVDMLWRTQSYMHDQREQLLQLANLLR